MDAQGDRFRLQHVRSIDGRREAPAGSGRASSCDGRRLRSTRPSRLRIRSGPAPADGRPVPPPPVNSDGIFPMVAQRLHRLLAATARLLPRWAATGLRRPWWLRLPPCLGACPSPSAREAPIPVSPWAMNATAAAAPQAAAPAPTPYGGAPPPAPMAYGGAPAPGAYGAPAPVAMAARRLPLRSLTAARSRQHPLPTAASVCLPRPGSPGRERSEVLRRRR